MSYGPMQQERLGIPQQVSSLRRSMAMTPTPEQEALEDPLIGPETYGLGKLAAKMTALPAALGMTVFHGSPHKFDKFDLSKIGTGEGAQAYGHGLYFAESPSVAKNYRTALAGPGTVTHHGQALSPTDAVQNNVDILVKDAGGNVQQAARKARQFVSELQEKDPAQASIFARVAETLEAGGVSHTPSGSLYHVDLPDDSIAKMLDWDKPLSQQPDVMKVLPQLGFKKYGEKPFEKYLVGPRGTLIDPAQSTGESIMTELGTGERATRLLREAGIPGVKYRDAGSRAAKEGTHNFVVFDDTLPKIKKKE